MLKNNQGETAKCEVSTATAMMTGILVRNDTIYACVKGYEEKGYTQVNNDE